MPNSIENTVESPASFKKESGYYIIKTFNFLSELVKEHGLSYSDSLIKSSFDEPKYSIDYDLELYSEYLDNHIKQIKKRDKKIKEKIVLNNNITTVL